MRASDRLTDSAVCLVASDGGPDRSLERLLAGAGRYGCDDKADPGDQSRVTASSPRSPPWAAATNAFKADAAHLLLDEARVLDGERPGDPKSFADRLARLMMRGVGSKTAN